MSSLSRMLAVLGEFSAEQPSLTADELAARLKLARTTCYRYARELCRAGLLVNSAGRYSLGHRIIQLDYQIRECDPLIRAGRERLRTLVEQTGASGLISSMYDAQVINIHNENAEHAPQISFGRGRLVPLFRGATSRVILANLRRTALKRLYERAADDPDRHLLGEDWPAFSRALAETRRRGYAVSRGELDSHLVGMAVAIPDAREEIAASLTLVFQEDRYAMFSEERLAGLLADQAKAIGEALAAS